MSSSEEEMPLNVFSNEASTSKRPNQMRNISNIKLPETLEQNSSTSSPISTIQIAHQSGFSQGGGTKLIRVYLATFMNIPHCGESDVFLEIECSTQATAGTILELLASKLRIEESKLKDCFGLWICSPLLGMQFKHRHEVLSIMLIWDKYLKAYSDADEETQKKDVPFLCLRRNVHLTVEKQQALMEEEENCVDILYQDAKSCVLRGDYYLKELDNIIELAAVGFAIDLPKEKKSEKATVDYMKKNLDKILHRNLANEIFEPMLLGKTFFTQKNNHMSTVYNMYVELKKKGNSPKENMKKYLEVLMSSCHSYGSAMFKMKMEIPDKKKKEKLLNASAMKLIDVNVGISSGYLTVTHKKEYLLVTDISGCISGECNFQGIKNDQNSVVLCFRQEDTENAAIHLYGAKSELLHHLLKIINHAKEQKPDSPLPIVLRSLDYCKAYTKNGEWVVLPFVACA